jgi:hypothetical protein
VSKAIGRSLLPKQRVGNPDGGTELFRQVDRGLYRLV